MDRLPAQVSQSIRRACIYVEPFGLLYASRCCSPQQAVARGSVACALLRWLGPSPRQPGAPGGSALSRHLAMIRSQLSNWVECKHRSSRRIRLPRWLNRPTIWPNDCTRPAMTARSTTGRVRSRGWTAQWMPLPTAVVNPVNGRTALHAITAIADMRVLGTAPSHAYFRVVQATGDWLRHPT